MKFPVVRLVVACVGLATAVYGLASLTGNWLHTPPWWRRDLSASEAQRVWLEVHGGSIPNLEGADTVSVATLGQAMDAASARPGREAISGALVAVGFAAVGVGLASAWPRRSKARPSDAA